MSDDDDVMLVKRSKQLHYGSLEEQEKARLAALGAAAKEGVEDTGGKDLGDIQVSNEYMDLEDEISKDKKALLEAPAKLQLAGSIRAACKNWMMQPVALVLLALLFVPAVLGTQSGLPASQQQDATCACSCEACYTHTGLLHGQLSGKCGLPNSRQRNVFLLKFEKENVPILCFNDLDIPTNESADSYFDSTFFKYVTYLSIFLIGMAVEFIRPHFVQYMRRRGQRVMWDGLITRVPSFFSSIQICRRNRHRSGNGSAREGTALVTVRTRTSDDESTPTGRSQRPLPTSSTTDAGTSAGTNTLRHRRSLLETTSSPKPLPNQFNALCCSLRVEVSESGGSCESITEEFPNMTDTWSNRITWGISEDIIGQYNHLGDRAQVINVDKADKELLKANCECSVIYLNKMNISKIIS